MARNKKKNPHYVNNKDFLAALIEFKREVKEAEDADTQRPQCTYYISECYMKIATHLSYKHNFINYTFREDMVMDGVENALQYMDNFNPEKYDNPFAYFTQIIYFAFLRRIQREKKNLYIKYKVTENANIFDLTADKTLAGADSKADTSIKQGEWSEDFMNEFVSQFEDHKRRKKKKRLSVDQFMEIDEPNDFVMNEEDQADSTARSDYLGTSKKSLKKK